MSRYTVWHSTGKLDGDASFDNIKDAEIEFADQSARSQVIEVTLLDNADDENPITIKHYTIND